MSENYENVSDEERARIETFSSYAKRYQHRTMFPLSKEEPFAPVLEARLKDGAFDFHRAAFPSIDAAIYLLNDVRGLKLLMDSVVELMPEVMSLKSFH